jgi:hypothetical protein
MQGLSERHYAANVGLSRGAIQKAKTAERLVLCPDGSINAAASDGPGGQQLDRHLPGAGPDARGPADGGTGQAQLAPADRSADRRKPRAGAAETRAFARSAMSPRSSRSRKCATFSSAVCSGRRASDRLRAP